MADRVTPLVFVGGSRHTDAEALLADAHEAIARDLLDRLRACPEFDPPIVAAASAEFGATLRDGVARVEVDAGAFHFGRVLARLAESYGVERAFYVGGGSAPLLTVAELSGLASSLIATDSAVIANNFFSSDFVAFRPADALSRIDLPAIDNDLAFRLQRQAGLRNIPLPRTPGTQLDVDTPTDLMILALHPNVGPMTRRFLDHANLDLNRVHQISRFLVDPSAEVVFCGRIGSAVLAHLETDAACRTRVLSEERGMRANGREASGTVRSILGFHLAAVGAHQFFLDLSELGDAAFVDSRVIFHHLGLNLSPSDRFNSDLLRPDEIDNPVAREFTAEAAAAPLPVVLGGHSLVAGGLWALIDAAWLERDRELAGGPTV